MFKKWLKIGGWIVFFALGGWIDVHLQRRSPRLLELLIEWRRHAVAMATILLNSVTVVV